MKHQKDWWKKYYGDETYFKIYGYTQKSAQKEVNFLINKLNLLPGMKILDLGCGFGRHSILLAKKGFNVTGLDFSNTLLKLARDKAKKSKVKLRFIKGDLRKLNFEEKFDVAILMFHTFGLLTDKENETVIKNISKTLNKNGKLFMDFRNPFKLLNGSSYKKEECLNGLKVFSDWHYNPKKKRLIIKRWFKLNRKTIYHIPETRIYKLNELKTILKRYGFKITDTFGNFNGERYKEDSDRLIIIAKKL